MPEFGDLAVNINDHQYIAPLILLDDFQKTFEGETLVDGKRAVIIPCEKWGPDPAAQGKEFLILGMPGMPRSDPEFVAALASGKRDTNRKAITSIPTNSNPRRTIKITLSIYESVFVAKP